MKKRLKKIIITLLVLLMMFNNFICVPAEQGNSFISGNWIYEVVSDGVVITGYTGEASDLIIPSTIDEKKVVVIGEKAFSNNKKIKNVIIPVSVRTINIYAFSDCTELKSITIPASVENILCNTIVGGFSDGNIIIEGEFVEGVSAFRGCTNLEEIKVDNNNNKYSSHNGVLYNKDKSELLHYPEGKKEKEFCIPDSVRRIVRCAFNNCNALETIRVPGSVGYIEPESIKKCENLKTVKFQGEKPGALDKFIFACDKVKIFYSKKYEEGWKDYNLYTKESYSEPWIRVERISINKSQFTITKGKSRQLKMAISPAKADDKSVVWSTSNSKVATVSQTGVVKAKGKGTCIISVITNDGKKKATCKVTVTVPVKKLKLNKSKVSIKKGKTYKLRCMITPKNATNKKIVWSSTNKKIAKVTKGRIKARKKGKCYVIVKTKDGKRKAKCKVVVK